jgi:hypothetical protein
MTDTPQPLAAGETDSSQEDEIQAAADAFKVELGQAEPPKRDPRGRFAAPDTGADDEIEAEAEEAEESEAEADAESQDEDEEGDEAADEAQPDDADLPKTWPADKAELWQSLDPDAQAYIRQRDAEQEAAVNVKFMEAANLRKAHEAEISEANANRQRFAELADTVLNFVVPKPPPRSMLDRTSSDFDPDEYHHRKAAHDEAVAFLETQKSQLAEVRAQEDRQRLQAINATTLPLLRSSVPDIADPAKAPAIIQGLMDYAVSLGTPPEVFLTDTTAVEWHVLWKAREYDRLQAAKGRVRKDPKPEPRKPQPAVRPGVATQRSAVEATRRNKAMDRLAQSGSVEDGAAAIKLLMRGT